MNLRRVLIYVAVLVVLALLGVLLALWGLTACAPPPLPGDEMWSLRQTIGEAVDLVLRLGSKDCFTDDAGGIFALWLGARTLGVVLVALAAIVLWELIGRDLRLRWFRARGGHVVLAGTSDDLAELARRQGRIAGTFFLAPDRAEAADLARHRPFAEIAAIAPRRLPRQLARLGASRAKLLAAATHNDLTNVAIAEAGLAFPASGELLVRLEQFAVRNLTSHRLRIRAAGQGRLLAVISLTQLQVRRGMAAAMSGRFTIEGTPRVHIALSGSGPALQSATFEVARQGFGLDREPPLVSILRTGSSDFAAGALPRLQQSAIADLRITDGASATADGLDRAIGAIVQDAPPLLAVHCIGETAGEAEAIALRWEEVLLALHQPVPPIIAYAAEDRPLGTTGMIRLATASDLAEARDVAQLMDQRARAVHQQFYDAQRAARGDSFGTAPAEAEWSRLPESIQDDNRAVADQMDFKLASAFMLARPGGNGVLPTPAEVEVLASIAHDRWMAAKAIGGWRYGTPRDDRRMLHPDMLPFAGLDEPARQKDRDEVASLPVMAALAGEALHRERRIGVAHPLDGAPLAAFRNNLAATPKTVIPVAVLPLDDAAMVRLAKTLCAAGVLVETMLDPSTEALRSDPATAADLADVLRQAWRIHVVPNGESQAVLATRTAETADETGAIHAHP